MTSNKLLTVSAVVKQMRLGISARDAFGVLLDSNPADFFKDDIPDSYLWEFLVKLAKKDTRERIMRARSPISSMERVIELILHSSNIVVIIGAGASIGPDFRSAGGLYDTIAKEGGLKDPYQVFDLDYFKEDPTVFWRYAHKIFPDKNPAHSEAHLFIEELEKRGKLLRLYSQNVDTLECGVPPSKLRCVHGSWRNSRCLQCGKEFEIEELRQYVETQTVPTCQCGGQIKPGIVFFGQKTNIEDEDIEYDSEHGDLMIVIGTSLRVAPISMLPNFMSHIPSILINREPVTCSFSAELLGDCSSVVDHIEIDLGWKEGEKRNVKFHDPNQFFFPDQDGKVLDSVESGRICFLVSTITPNDEDLM